MILSLETMFAYTIFFSSKPKYIFEIALYLSLHLKLASTMVSERLLYQLDLPLHTKRYAKTIYACIIFFPSIEEILILINCLYFNSSSTRFSSCPHPVTVNFDSREGSHGRSLPSRQEGYKRKGRLQWLKISVIFILLLNTFFK